MRNNIVLIVFKKELLDIFRDRKTLILSILIPLIVLPALSYFIGKASNNDIKNVEKSISINITDKSNSNLSKFIKAQKNIKIINSKDVSNDIRTGKILLSITIPKDLDKNIAHETDAKITMDYDNSSTNASTAVSIVKAYIDQYSKEIVSKRLSDRNINANILNPIDIVEDTIDKKESGVGKMMIVMLVPLLLIIYSITGTMAAATDLGVGEKERGTLEPLLTTKANRMSILWGKLFAIAIMGIIISLASLSSLFIAMQQKNGIFSSTGKADLNLNFANIILIMLIPILLTMVFGAIQLSISIYAKSFKEAQTYLSPVMIIGMILAYLTMLKDAKSIEGYYFNIPITNASCLIKELLVGIYNYNHIAITFIWMIVYVVVALLFARYMFSREDVVFRA
ncbi:ABC transporter permease [Clostridium pasteurianum]|uniref:ABC-type Na+ efflux pump, permease component n=1 Tax=Clostridium pasteurianum BC1 TaxID=86416 RepID=R4JY86_CLOPA|nr:ABC transporter permease [Clostridium pasteurianum]AGK95248.1 ABC-type Na+ efflux pump, permease component [Clostridium pasteurianum BC1]